MKNSKGGRPKKDPEQRRSRNVGVRFSELEYLSILEDAAKVNKTPVSFIRSAALNFPLKSVPAINKEAWSELGKFCGRLNQIMKAKTAGDTTFVNISLNEFKEMRDIVQRLREELKK